MRALSVVILVIGTAIGIASPAAADETTYLSQLQPMFGYVTPGQLLDEGLKACRYVGAGRASPGAVDMVAKDLNVGVYAATTIVQDAVVDFDC